jgi:putative sterol carrier protein
MSAKEFFSKLPGALNPDAASGMNCVLQFNTGSPVYLTVANGACSVTDGSASNADVTITMEEGDLIQLMKGELNGMTAFMTGKLQVDGDLMLAQRLQNLFDSGKL